MATEMGEYLVGAYLKLLERCDFVDYNVRSPGGGLAGLDELDVIGINFGTRTAYLCEVTTHLRGLLYKTNRATVERVRTKHGKQRSYAKTYLGEFTPKFMFWSPYVPRGYLTDHLGQIEGLDLVINGKYKSKVQELQHLARKQLQETGNPVYRVLQILGALRD